MAAEEVSRQKERSLRVVLPEFYRFITGELEQQYNIHPYDIQITATEDKEGFDLNFYYGEGYAHKESHFFSRETIKLMDKNVSEFIDEFGESCKQAMIADYYKMLKM